MRRTRKYLGQLLLDNGVITEKQLADALEYQRQSKSDKRLGQILIDKKYITQQKIMDFLAKQLASEYVELKNYPLDPAVIKLLPEFDARRLKAIVLKHESDTYIVGMVDPQDLLALEQVEQILGGNVTVVLISEDDLMHVLDNFYRRSEDISLFAEKLSAQLTPTKSATDIEANINTSDMPVAKLLRSIFEDAAQINASDIHLEPDEQMLRIRLRVDGVLQEQLIKEKSISAALIQRVKIMANLNIAEKRLPQDGRFTIDVKHKKFDVRVSTLPTQYGESVVLRLLNQSATLFTLKDLEMPEKILSFYANLLTIPYGIILIVGPTGSGKTTTLYASLNELNSPDDKIITVEDPVEYRISRINQVQVNVKIGLTFANCLRSILRQDPDIIMIGEMRDQETVEIALRSAMTGHLVLATLHTNDTISAATRLIDMGAEGYIVAGVLRAVMSQRLVRKICKRCITDATLSDYEENWLKNIGMLEKINSIHFKKGAGCTYCRQTGYLGRTAVFELLPIEANLQEPLREKNIGAFIHLAEKAPLYQPLLKSGLQLVESGVTTLDEIIRMAGAV